MKQQGVAIITAILIMTMAAIAASGLIWQQGLWTRNVSNLGDQAQGQVLAASGINWARAVLAQDAKDNRNDHLDEHWAQPLTGLDIEGQQLSGFIEDQHSRFNLNNLVQNDQVSSADLAIFLRLLEQLDLPVTLADPLIDWIDSDNLARAGGAEDGSYLTRNPPYRCANQPLISIAGLSRVQGINDEILHKLAPYITALPSHTPININTASAQLLSAALDISAAVAQSIIAARQEQAFSDINLKARIPAAPDPLSPQLFSVSSQYFLVTSRSQIATQYSGFRALLNRSGGAWPRVLWRVQEGAA